MGMEHRITDPAARGQDRSTGEWVRETRFGPWVLGTDIWRKYVLADGSVDMVLCHQVLHHMVQQRDALAEMYRVLRPGGLLFLAESCHCFIESNLVRAFFRHRPEAQRSAAHYVQLVRNACSQLSREMVLTESRWWSRPDLGLGGRLGIPQDKGRVRESTEVICVAVKAP